MYEKVAAYIQVAKDSTVHMVPNAIMHHIIRKVEKFITTDLLVHILNDMDENKVSSIALSLCNFVDYVFLYLIIVLNRLIYWRPIKKPSTNTTKTRKCMSFAKKPWQPSTMFIQILAMSSTPKQIKLLLVYRSS